METTVIFTVVLVLLGPVLIVNGEKHSLHYIYTAISKPVHRPGIHEFTAMGVLDGNLIDYFDSDKQVKVPKQSWMKTKLEPSYWEKGTQSRKSKQQWFKVNINILKERFRQNDSDIHVLQWIHGCEIGTNEEFIHGIDMYSYDGAKFLSFDEDNENWVATNDAARQTKEKWDHLQVLKEYTKVYLKKECVNWLTTFLKNQKENEAPVDPDVYAFSRGANVQTNIVLTCMATGFSSINTIIKIKRDGRVLTNGDGVQSSGIRPNGDGTFQQEDHVEIPKSDQSKYTCEVISDSFFLHKDLYPEKVDFNVVMVVVVAVVVLGILVLVVIGIVVGVKRFFPGQREIIKSPQAAAVHVQINGIPKGSKPPEATAPLLKSDGIPEGSQPPEATAPLLKIDGSNSSQDSGISSSETSSQNSLGPGPEEKHHDQDPQ